jgi:DNA-binding NarL/FixJ family response regulator
VLSVSERTVERHLENSYRKVGARNRAEVTAYALRNNLT